MSDSGLDPASARRAGWRDGLAVEALLLGVVVALVAAKLATVSTGTWRAVFLANGDSLVLPLVLQSLQRGEPFQWVFSSQTFFFPEFPLYALCGLLMGSPQGGLVLNAILNVVLLYLGVRAVSAAFAPGERARQRLVSLGAVALFLVAMLTEAQVTVIGAGTVEPSRIATVFLMTTYYGGALLVSLGMLALVLWVSDRFSGAPAARRRVVVYGVIIVVVGGATIYSDPIFLLWFLVPVGLALLGLLIARRITLRWALIVLFPLVLALGAGMLARALLARFIAADLAHYIATFGAVQAAELLGRVVQTWLRTPAGVLQLIVLVVPFVVVVAFCIRSLRRGASTAEVFLVLFIVASAITLIAGQIATGQSVTRYLLPLFVYPPLGLLLVRDGGLRRRVGSWSPAARRTRTAVAASVAAIGVVVAIGVASPAVAALASPRSPVDTACLRDWLRTQPDAGRTTNGVGSFWVVRALALYGTQDGKLLQVAQPLAVHAWMTNLAPYRDTSFSYVLADDVIGVDDWAKSLGDPSSTVTCDGYRILDYARTPGATDLTDAIRRSERQLLAAYDR